MTGQQLKERLISLYGVRGWQTKAAAALGFNVSSIRRWVSGQLPVPKAVALALLALAAPKKR